MKPRKRVSAGQVLFKIIMIGNSGAGKSCLLSRYIKNTFNPEYHVTLGAEFQSKIIAIDQNYKVRLQLWDTAGQQTFRSIIKSFYKNSAAIMLVYNIMNQKSFKDLEIWYKEAKENSPEDAQFILVGTHLDLAKKDQIRPVNRQDIDKFTTEHKISLAFQISSKENINIQAAFNEIANIIFIQYLQKRKASLKKGELQLKKQQKRICCN